MSATCLRGLRRRAADFCASRISSEIVLLGHVSLLLTAVSDALLRNSHDR